MKTTRDINVDLGKKERPLKQVTTKDVEVKYIDTKERVGSKILVSTHDIEDFVKETNKRNRMEKARAAKGKKK